MFIKGFLFIIGCLIGLFVFFFILVLFFKLAKKQKHAIVSVWKEYYYSSLAIEDFKEAEFVMNLIGGKQDAEEIKTPQGYKVHVDRSIEIDDENESGKSKVNVVKKFKIVKLKK